MMQNFKQTLENVKGKKQTLPFLTKFEKARLIGLRGKQIADGSPVLVQDTDGLTPSQIAIKELEERVLPLIVQRPLPNGEIENWSIVEFEVI